MQISTSFYSVTTIWQEILGFFHRKRIRKTVAWSRFRKCSPQLTARWRTKMAVILSPECSDCVLASNAVRSVVPFLRWLLYDSATSHPNIERQICNEDIKTCPPNHSTCPTSQDSRIPLKDTRNQEPWNVSPTRATASSQQPPIRAGATACLVLRAAAQGRSSL